MKKLSLFLCMVLVTVSMFAQAIDLSKVDLSNARMSLAGPDRIYVANIYYQGTRLSVLLESDGANGAVVHGPWFDDDKLLQDYLELGYASLRIQGDDTLLISDIVIGGQGYSGRFKYDGVYTITYDRAWTTDAPVAAETEIAALKEQLGNTRQRYEEQLRATSVVQEEQLKELKLEFAAAERVSNSKVGELKTELASTVRVSNTKVRGLETELAAVRKVAEAAGADVSAVSAVTLPSRIQKSGFAGGRSVSGSWTSTSSRAAQTDNGSYYAKFRIPLAQSARETLYSFDARATGTGFAGYGLHFFVSNEIYGAGYGYGTSYLVWLTRDANYYGTDATYVQLYRSDDDVAMVQMASATIADSVNSVNSTDVLYDPSAGTITVSVNGTEYLSVAVKSPIRRGSSIALRALGSAIFSDLTVKTK